MKPNIYSKLIIFAFLIFFYNNIYSQIYNVQTDSVNYDESGTIIVLKSDLKNTQIYMNNTILGTTPFNFKATKNVEYMFSFIPSNLNFNRVDTTIVLKEMIDTLILNIDFKKSWLSINCNIDSADVLLHMKSSIYTPDKIGLRLSKYCPMIHNEIYPGSYTVTIKKSGYSSESYYRIFKPRSNSNINITLNPLSKNKALLFSSLFPGLGQWYSEKPVKGLLMNIIAIGSISTSFITNNTISEYKAEYKSLQSEYRNSTSVTEINSSYEKLKDKFDKLEQMQNIRNIFIGVSISVYIASIVDVYFNWPFDNLHLKANLNSKENTNLSFVYVF